VRMKRLTILRILIPSILAAITILCGLLGYRLHENYKTDKKLKSDYFIVNQIKYGLLSGNNWAVQVNQVLALKIDSFNVTRENRKVLVAQVSEILNRMIDEANKMLHKKRENVGERLKFALINVFFDIEDLRKEVPRFSEAVIDELDKSQNKEKIKKMLKEKVSGILDATNQDSIGAKAAMIKSYNKRSITEFNKYIGERTDTIRLEQRRLGFIMTGMLGLILLTWLLILKTKELHATGFLISVLASFTALFIGVSLPMIEIDARISELNLELLSSHIVFYDQVIFYQAKSILDVIRILIVHGHADTVFVGVLILLFSVLFPVTKLICTTIYLFAHGKSNGFVRYMAFHSAKWSMADVMVIAIFMAYVGFKSILDNQLKDITVATDAVNVVTTNKTNLQTGYMVFVAFTIFNLMLGEILKRITREKRNVLKKV
jgi:hypothetical protein